MEKVKVIIADDEINVINRVKNVISQREDVLIVGEARNGIEEIELINKFNPDIVFTDNQMPILNGIDVIESFLNKNDRPFFVMISSDSDMVHKSIEYNFVYFEKLKDFLKLNDIIDYYKDSKNNNYQMENIENKKKGFRYKFFKRK